MSFLIGSDEQRVNNSHTDEGVRRKYEFTGDTKPIIDAEGKERTLRRIRAVRDIPKHNVPAGGTGGWIESEDNLSQEGDCWVGGESQVYGKAHVTGDALVTGGSVVCDEAIVCGLSLVAGSVRIKGRAKIARRAQVTGSACVSGQALISERAVVANYAHVTDQAVVMGDARVRGWAKVGGNARIEGRSELEGYSIIGGDVVLSGAYVWDRAEIKGSVRLYGSASICGYSVIDIEDDGLSICADASIRDGARIRYADDILVLSPVGSENGTLTAYVGIHYENDEEIPAILVTRGCYKGTLDQFEQRVKRLGQLCADTTASSRRREAYLKLTPAIRAYLTPALERLKAELQEKQGGKCHE
jgi:hypothetical protein